MKFSYCLIATVLLLSSCGPSVSISTTRLAVREKMNPVHVVVMGDYETDNAMNYVKQLLSDSLKKNFIDVTSTYTCCRNKATDVNKRIEELLPDPVPRYILAAVITKVVIGYGTGSSRELVIDLWDSQSKKSVWYAKLHIDVAWFKSEKNYNKFGKKVNDEIIAEMKRRKII
jgi:hypothetical protein